MVTIPAVGAGAGAAVPGRGPFDLELGDASRDAVAERRESSGRTVSRRVDAPGCRGPGSGATGGAEVALGDSTAGGSRASRGASSGKSSVGRVRSSSPITAMDAKMTATCEP